MFVMFQAKKASYDNVNIGNVGHKDAEEKIDVMPMEMKRARKQEGHFVVVPKPNSTKVSFERWKRS